MTQTLLSKIPPNRYKVLPSHNSSKPRLRIWKYLDKAVAVPGGEVWQIPLPDLALAQDMSHSELVTLW